MVDFSLIFAFFGAFALGIVFWAFIRWLIERRARSMLARNAQAIQAQKKADDATQLIAMMTEIKLAWDSKGEQDTKSFVVQKIIPIALKYPEVMFKYGRKLLKMFQNKNGEGFDLEGLLKGGLGGIQ